MRGQGPSEGCLRYCSKSVLLVQLGGHTSTGICLPINQCKKDQGGCEYGCTTDEGKAVCSCP